MRVYKLWNGTYKWRIDLVVDCDEVEFVNWLRRRYNSETPVEGLEGCTLEVDIEKPREKRGVIWLGYTMPRGNDITKGLLCGLNHEINHATIMMLNYVGVDLKDSEAFCYAADDLFDQALNHILPRKGRRSRPRSRK